MKHRDFDFDGVKRWLDDTLNHGARVYCCDEHRTRPLNGSDWRAVHVLMAQVAQGSVECSELFMRIAADRISGKPTSPLLLVLAGELVAKSFALDSIVIAHTTLVRQGVLLTENADIHYDRLLGMCEEKLEKLRNGQEAGPEASEIEGSGLEDQGSGSCRKRSKSAADES